MQVVELSFVGVIGAQLEDAGCAACGCFSVAALDLSTAPRGEISNNSEQACQKCSRHGMVLLFEGFANGTRSVIAFPEWCLNDRGAVVDAGGTEVKNGLK